MFARVALLASVLIACTDQEPSALPPVSEGAVTAHVERFVHAGRTTTAFADLLRSRPLREQVQALALTVWPALLAAPLHGDSRSADLLPMATESADDYLARLCAGPLQDDCGAVLPEQRAVVVRAIAMRRANERMQAALSACLACKTPDQSWEQLGWMWQSLDREATGYRAELWRNETRTHVVAMKR